jgi:hypothetical protein
MFLTREKEKGYMLKVVLWFDQKDHLSRKLKTTAEM